MKQPRVIVDASCDLTKHCEILCLQVEQPVPTTEEEATICKFAQCVLSIVAYPFGSCIYDFHGKGRSGFTRKPTRGAVLPRIKSQGRKLSPTCRLSELPEGHIGSIADCDDNIDDWQDDRRQVIWVNGNQNCLSELDWRGERNCPPTSWHQMMSLIDEQPMRPRSTGSHRLKVHKKLFKERWAIRQPDSKQIYVQVDARITQYSKDLFEGGHTHFVA